jgi:hypothetical protein
MKRQRYEIKGLNSITTGGYKTYEGTTVEFCDDSGRYLFFVVVDPQNNKFVRFTEDLTGEFVDFATFASKLDWAVEWVEWLGGGYEDLVSETSLPVQPNSFRTRFLTSIFGSCETPERSEISLLEEIESLERVGTLKLKKEGVNFSILNDAGTELFFVDFTQNDPRLVFTKDLRNLLLSGDEFVRKLQYILSEMT